MPTKKKSKRIEVKTSNALIDGAYNMTLSQVKLFLFMLAEVKKHGRRDSYKIFVSDLIDVPMPKKRGRPSTHSLISEYKRADSILESLQHKMIVIPSGREDAEARRIPIIEYVDYDPEKRLGYFYFGIHEKLFPELIDLEGKFTRYDIRNVIACRSVFSVRMYMILKTFERLKEREIPLDELKEMLAIEGKYKLYGDIKRYILLRAQKELKKVSDMFFEFKEIRKGKRVYAILFKIKMQDQQRLFNGSPYPDAETVLKQAELAEAVQYGEWSK